MHIAFPDGLPLEPVDLNAADTAATVYRTERAQSAWSVQVAGQPAADLVAWVVPLHGISPGALRHELRGGAGSDVDGASEEDWLSTRSGSALRFRQRDVVQRSDHPLPLVTERVVWSWVIGERLLVLAVHTLFLVLAEEVFDVVDRAALEMVVEFDG